ncbi:hypothetical protein [Pelagicoccus mobilis]|uniref:Nucleoside hydrolase n=1 Tax=Pelagicoccus mobilis TaxID=415221 RepID=A0A934RQ84_9BACT|nr:hypothetical protein [Pelagicoccus mobilis]MBK1875500.1 hypothetical protein [Pelagicoccus mobilis]
MLKTLVVLFLLVGTRALVADPIKVILDTDMGSDCDDVGAMALLHSYAIEGKVEILGVIYSSGRVPYGVGLIDAINTYYGKPDLPIGAYKGDEVGDPVDKMQAEKLAKDTAAFGHDLVSRDDVEDQTRLNRSLLAAAEDESIHYITIGHTNGFSELLASKPDEFSDLDGVELVRKKVKRWIALGALNADRSDGKRSKDWNFFNNGSASFSKHAVDTCPVPVVYVNAGHRVMTGRSLIPTESGNIVRTAYRDWLWNYSKKTLEDQRPSWDLAAVYYAVEGLGPYLKEADPGRLDFDPVNGCRWDTDTVNDRELYVNQLDGTDAAFARYLDELMCRYVK